MLREAARIIQGLEQKELQALFADVNGDEDARVVRVLQIYKELGIQPHIEEAIRQQFALAKEQLDAIQVEEIQKAPLQQLMETLLGRKK